MLNFGKTKKSIDEETFTKQPSTQQTLQLNTQSAACESATIDFQLEDEWEITNICEDACSSCDQGSGCINSGHKFFEFTATKDLSDLMAQGCCEMTIEGIDRCCRDNSFCNISTGTFYMSHYLNPCKGSDGCPELPTFSAKPATLACKDKVYRYNVGADIDSDDSLGFELVPPLEDGGQNVTWASGYSLNEPLDYKGKGTYSPSRSLPYGFHFDEETGDIAFTPTDECLYGMRVRVNQYNDDNELVSQFHRDFLIKAIHCFPDAPPESNYSKTHQVCAGEENTIDFEVSNPDSAQQSGADSVFINWNQGIEDASFTPDSGEAKATGTLTWEPGLDDIRDRPYTFLLHAYNKSCPIPGDIKEVIEVDVKNPPDISYTIDQKECGEVNFNAEVENREDASFEWYINGEKASEFFGFSSQFESGEHAVNLKVSDVGCDKEIKDTFEVSRFSIEAGNDTALCENNTLTIEPNAANAEGQVNYEVNGKEFTDQIDIIPFSDPTIVVEGWDANGCHEADTFHIEHHSLPEPQVDDQRLCPEEELPTLNSQLPEGFEVSWKNKEGNLLEEGETFSVPDTGEYLIQAHDPELTRCSASNEFKVTMAPQLSQEFADTSVCRGETLSMEADAGDSPYNWYTLEDGQKSFISTGENLNYQPDSSKPIIVESHQNYQDIVCSFEDTFYVEVQNSPSEELQGPGSLCLNEASEKLPESEQYDTYWEGAGVDNNIWNPEMAGVGHHTLKYTLETDQGCENRDSIEATVHELPELEFSVEPETGEFPLMVTMTGSVENDGLEPAWQIYDAHDEELAGYQGLWEQEHRFDTARVYDIAFSAAEEENGCRDTLRKDGKVVVNTPSFLADEENLNINYYPNPTKETFRIESPEHKIEKVALIDGSGREILSKAPGIHQTTIDRDTIEAGVYRVRLKIEGYDEKLIGNVVFE